MKITGMFDFRSALANLEKAGAQNVVHHWIMTAWG
jgi:hypothetical protein